MEGMPIFAASVRVRPAHSFSLLALLALGAPLAADEPVAPTASALRDAVDARRLAAYHELFTREPHVSGSAGDQRMIESLATTFRELGLEVEVDPFRAYLPRPLSARLEIVAAPSALLGEQQAFGGAAALAEKLPLTLPLIEEPVEADPQSGDKALDIGWNAYSGSGTAEGQVVYAHFGRKEDFERLKAAGIDLRGKIVLARYGGNYRGYKALFAEAAGAAGLLIFTDPEDAGYVRGETWPRGGWANATQIQRGSLLTLPYPGDPLTPFVAAKADAGRLDPASVALPKIPVQPIGWGAAFAILRRMSGQAMPTGEGWAEWQGGLPIPYRLEGGPALRLRLQVAQERRLVDSANVVGYLRGSEQPDALVIVGSHFDAWNFGAGDPNSGTILVVEAARVFAEAAKTGWRPRRTLVFAHWGAEEFGIIGSTEWVEGRQAQLLEHGVAYLNLDGAAMGTAFNASSSPSLKGLIEDVARAVPQPGGTAEETVWQRWTADGKKPAEFGDLGGGSDHIGFYCHAAVPSASLSAHGSPGSAYHSNYETLAWYRRVVGDDYAGAVMLSRLVVGALHRLGDDDLLPFDPSRYAVDLRRHLDGLVARAKELGVALNLRELDQELIRARTHGGAVHSLLRLAVRDPSHYLHRDGEARALVNANLHALERSFYQPEGLPDRPWFRNLFAASDADSGYAPWMVPALRQAVESRRADDVPAQVARYRAAIARLEQHYTVLERALAAKRGAP